MSNLHTPKRNLFLAALPETDFERLKCCLELVSLPPKAGQSMKTAAIWTLYIFLPLALFPSLPLAVMENQQLSQLLEMRGFSAFPC